ncbi:MAG: orotate phosphoribosyltransferase [Phycisphaerales bacterium]
MPDLTSHAMELLERTGAVKSGHFLLSSGLHSAKYCQCAALFEHPAVAAELADMLVRQLPADLKVDVVMAPALGGILWGYELARALGAARGVQVRSFFAERPTGQGFELRRSFVLAAGDRVLLAEDVVTTGGSVSELVPLVEAAGARVVGFAAVADRSRGKFQPMDRAGARVPFHSIVKLDFETYDQSVCPMCRAGSMAAKPGSRAVPVGAPG